MLASNHRLQEKKGTVGGQGNWPPKWPPESTASWFGSPRVALEFRWKEFLFAATGNPPVVGGGIVGLVLVADIIKGGGYLPESARIGLVVVLGVAVLLSVVVPTRPRPDE